MTTTRMPRSAAGWLVALAVGLGAWAAPAAQASQHVAGAAKATALRHVSYKYTFSRIAWTGSRKVIAATDSRHDLYFFWEASTSATWHKQLVAKGGRSARYSSPSITWTGHAVAIAALDGSGDLLSFTQRSGSTRWRRSTVAKAHGYPYLAPSVSTAGDGTVLISAGDKANRLFSFTLAPHTSNWIKAGVSVGGLVPAPSITACYDGIVHAYLGLITATSGGTLYFWWKRLDSTNWNQEVIAFAGPGASFTGASIVATDGDLLITAATTAGAIDLWWQPIGGSTWSQQTVASPSGGTSYTHAMVTWTGPVLGGPDSYDVVTATTRNGTLVYWWKLDGGSTWTRERVAKSGRRATYANPAIAVSARSVIITAINTKPGDVLFWFQPFGTNPWHKQTVAKG